MEHRLSSVAGIAALRAGARLSTGVHLARPGELYDPSADSPSAPPEEKTAA